MNLYMLNMLKKKYMHTNYFLVVHITDLKMNKIKFLQ